MGNTLINAITFKNIFGKLGGAVSTAFMLGDDNLFASNCLMSESEIIDSYKEFGLDVKVVIREGPYESKFLQSYLCPVKIDG